MKRLLITLALLTIAGCTQVNPQTGVTENTLLGDVVSDVSLVAIGASKPSGQSYYAPPPRQTICEPRGDGSYQCQ